MRKHVGVDVQARRKRVIVLAEEFHSSAPFSKEELSMIGELRFDDLGYERKLDCLEKTSCSRRKWIVNCRPTFDDLLKTFPPLKDLAIHFQKDFCCIFPESNDFLAHWEQITPQVISWARQKTNLMVKQILAELDMQDNPFIGINSDGSCDSKSYSQASFSLSFGYSLQCRTITYCYSVELFLSTDVYLMLCTY